MGKSKSKAPAYPTTTVNTGLFGSSTTNRKGSTFTPKQFQKDLIGITESNAGQSLQNYLNPDYESEDYKRGDKYYTNKMQNQLENNYLNPALARNLLRGSTASDVMRGFANDLANTEYERQNDYRNQQLQNYNAAMLPYTTLYDMMTGTEGLTNALSNQIANYNLAQNQANQANKGGSGIGNIIGTIGQIRKTAAAYAPLFTSDRRLKENLKKLDEVDGINIYKFDFINGDKNQIGVIAQELEKEHPECVFNDGGYLMVDYSLLPQKVQDRINELRLGAEDGK